MVLVVQCPGCAKYMLVEDEQRGQAVRCLLCPTEFLIEKLPTVMDSSPTSRTPPMELGQPEPTPIHPPAKAPIKTVEDKVIPKSTQVSSGTVPRPPAAKPPTDVYRDNPLQDLLVMCAQCGADLHIPAEYLGQQVACPQCQYRFTAQKSS